MHKTLTLLKTNPIIKSYDILDFKSGKDFYYIKAITTLKDDSNPFIREFISSSQYIYAYHWQAKNRNIIIRWDNALHHPNLKTFPHHKHSPGLTESTSMNLEDVLKEISQKININEDLNSGNDHEI